jgi:Protein of unknown function (DUF3307)
VPWSEVFIVLLLSHLAGDFLLQTDWQAEHKHGGLNRGGEAFRALFSHLITYTLAFVPALIWIGDGLGTGSALATAALVFFPHLLQDDGRLIARYIALIKGPGAAQVPLVLVAVDQSFHLLALFGTALLVTA